MACRTNDSAHAHDVAGVLPARPASGAHAPAVAVAGLPAADGTPACAKWAKLMARKVFQVLRAWVAAGLVGAVGSVVVQSLEEILGR